MLHEIALDLAIPNLNDVVQTDGYKGMPDELQNRLIQQLPYEHGLVRLDRKRAKYCVWTGAEQQRRTEVCLRLHVYILLSNSNWANWARMNSVLLILVISI